MNSPPILEPFLVVGLVDVHWGLTDLAFDHSLGSGPMDADGRLSAGGFPLDSAVVTCVAGNGTRTPASLEALVEDIGGADKKDLGAGSFLF